MFLLVCFLISFLASFILTPFFTYVARSVGLIDNPDAIIKLHKNPVPYLGGVAICLSTLFPLLWVDNIYVLFFFSITLLGLLGLIDDIYILKPQYKLAGQAVIASYILYNLSAISGVHFLHTPFHYLVAFFWILTVVNAVNLIDVMDGLATLVAIFTSTTFFLLLYYYDASNSINLFLLSFLGAACAFFWYNKPQASIYLGDTGSLYIGGFLSVIPFFIPFNTCTEYGFFGGVTILGIPLIELVSLISIRWYHNLSPYKGSRHHFCHYLQKKGWSRTHILIFVATIHFFLSMISIGYVLNFIDLKFFILLILLLAFSWVKAIYN